MKFELTPELVDQIIFGMENQERQFLIDLEQSEVVQSDNQPLGSEDRFIELPEWNSASGFQLMERFVASLQNPVFRETLREALAGGKGVFRRFKNTLKDEPRIERLWFSFKEKEMRRHVIDWYSTLVESLGLKPIEFDMYSDETSELVLSDFQFRVAGEEDLPILKELDREGFLEAISELPEEISNRVYENQRAGFVMEAGGVTIVETPNGDLAGFIWVVEYSDDPFFSFILQLFVLQEYRGLGLAKILVERYCSNAFKRGVEWILLEIGGAAPGFQDILTEMGFTQMNVGLKLDAHRWGLENFYA